MAKWEAVYHVGASIHVIVEAETQEKALQIADEIACRTSDSVTLNYNDSEAQVWWGEPDDLAYIDRLEG